MDSGLIGAQSLLAADEGSSITQGPGVVIALAVIALLGTVFTALGPSLVEIAKSRVPKKNPAPSPGPTPTENPGETKTGPPQTVGAPVANHVIESAYSGLSLIEAAVVDARVQRDHALRRAEQQEETIRRQAVYIAQLEGWLNAPPPGGGYPYPT